MTTEDYKRIEKAFNHALILNENEREAFIKAFEASHPQLGLKLRQLIAADAAPGDSIASPIMGAAKSLAEETTDPWIGRQIGVWKVVRRLGAGGMGAVFLAQRTDAQFEQQVALKIMGAQALDMNAAARFRAERQILANLSHPNIATLIDGGATDHDLPFLVMEFINGVPIGEFCDAQNLTLKDRLRLFVKVCEGVDYAHRNLVVHRDLKPSNILVTDSGEPKLLDFGIAKLLEPGAYELTVAQTGDGARIMTPEYASPEQVRGEQVTVATDVYALGVLLFRLLTGQSPYGPSATTVREIENAVLDVDPKRPSVIVSSSTPGAVIGGPSAADISEKRAASPEKLRKSLAGDLDNIVLKCLQKDPERRYATARELSADIERYLTNRPVIARGDSWTYKTKKFLVRNARFAAAAAGVVVTIISLVSFYTLRLADERDKAQLAAAEAEQVATFLTNIFRNADPHTAKGRPATAVDLLKSAEARINDLDDQPLLQARLAQIIGDTYTNLGETAKAIELLEWSREMRLSVLLDDPTAHGQLLLDLAEAYRVSGKLEAAERAMRQSIIQFERRLLTDHPRILYLNGRLAVVLSDQGRKAEALDLLQEKLRQCERLNPRYDEASLDMLGNIAHMLVDLGRFEEAETTHLKVVRLSKDIDGPLHPNTLIRIQNFALMRMRQYRFQESERLYDEALAGARQVWPENYPSLLRLMSSRAFVKAHLGRFDEAFDDFAGALETLRQTQDETTSVYLSQVRYYCAALAMAGRLKEAAATLENAIVLSTAGGIAHENATNMLRVGLADVRNLQNLPEEALTLLDLAARDKRWMTEIRAADYDTVRAVSFSLLGRDQEASALFYAVIANKSDFFGSDAAPMIRVYVEAAAHHRRSGDNQKAEAYARRAYNIGRSSLPARNWIAATATAELAYALNAQGRTEEARGYADKAHADLLAVFGPEDYRVIKLNALIQ